MAVVEQPGPPVVDGDGRGRLVDGGTIGAHTHPQGQLVYASAGVLITTTVLGTWTAPMDRITWTPPRVGHRHRAYGETEVLLLEVPDRLCAALPDRPTVFAVTPLLREALVVLTGERVLRDSARERLRQVVVDELDGRAEPNAHLPEPTDDRLRAVADLLRADPGNGSTLAELGHRVGASERTLGRLFRTELGMGFQQWRTLLRVQHSFACLADGHSVTSTASLCGWSNPTSFIEAFTALIGQTPGRYRRCAP